MASTKKEDDLVASISKTMTVDKLKEDLRLANIGFSSARKKSDFVDLYISNGLHNKGEVEAIVGRPEVSSVKAEAKAIVVKPKEELVLSLIISAHGDETFRWTKDFADISSYYKKNVRVYSRGCVPGVATIRNMAHVSQSIHDAYNIFKKRPESATEEIMAEYTGLDKNYYTNYLDSLDECNFQDEIGKIILENKGRCGGLSTYLSNKVFSVATDEDERSTYYYEKDFNNFMASRGINVSDIRLKITAPDGSVSYRQIFNPRDEWDKYLASNPDVEKEPFDVSKFNLFYRNGMEFIMKDALHREDLLGRALEIFNFTAGKDKTTDISLVQLYNFFKMVGFKYVNIIDHSCRVFHTGMKMTSDKNEKLFKEEQKYIVKPVAFGKRSSTLKDQRSKRRSTLKGKSSKRKHLKPKKPRKYSRKI